MGGSCLRLRLECGQSRWHVGIDGENLLQANDLEDVLHARAQRGQGQTALVALHGLKNIRSAWPIRGVDVIHAAEIQQQRCVFAADFGFRNSRSCGEVSRSTSPLIQTTGMFSSVRSVICIWNRGNNLRARIKAIFWSISTFPTGGSCEMQRALAHSDRLRHAAAMRRDLVPDGLAGVDFSARARRA